MNLNPQWRTEVTQDVLDDLVTFGQRFLRDPRYSNGPVYQTEMEDYFEGEMKNEEGFATENQVRYIPSPLCTIDIEGLEASFQATQRLTCTSFLLAVLRWLCCSHVCSQEHTVPRRFNRHGLPRTMATFLGHQSHAHHTPSYTPEHDPEVFLGALLDPRHGQMGPPSHEDLARRRAKDVDELERL